MISDISVIIVQVINVVAMRSSIRSAEVSPVSKQEIQRSNQTDSIVCVSVIKTTYNSSYTNGGRGE